MPKQDKKSQLALEVMLIILCVGLACVLYKTPGFRIVVLNLFYLPVVLGAFFLGRYRGAILALFSVIITIVVTMLDLADFSGISSPLTIGISVTLWAAVIGLTALLLGTVSDESAAKTLELREAYLGVVEVLSRYLQSASPGLKARASRVAELSQEVATQMRLSPQEIDDIRVAALLQDFENIEITAKVIRKAVGNLEQDADICNQHTFHGNDLVQSLGTVLSGALPMLLSQGRLMPNDPLAESGRGADAPLLGVAIIHAVGDYDALRQGEDSLPSSPLDLIRELRNSRDAHYDPHVVDALERVVSHVRKGCVEELQPV